MPLIKETIFKAYDLRGLYPDEINEDFALKFGYFFLPWLQKQKRLPSKKIKIVLGGDGRFSTPILKKALLKGLLSYPLVVYDLGKVTTPLFYFALKKTQADFGIMITASHLPAVYNGLKIVDRNLLSFSGWELKSILEFFPLELELKKEGQLERKDFSQAYQDFLLKKLAFLKEELVFLKKKKIIINCLKGMTGPILKKLKRRLALPWQLVFDQPSPYFCQELSSKTKEKLAQEMKRLILKAKGELGVIFDGDGDRVLFFDSQGNFLREDLLGALLVEEILKKKRGTIVVDQRSTRMIREIVRKNGGRLVFSPVGHRFFKERMKKFQALFGLEKSGHYYFRDFFFADSGLFTFLKVLKILAQKKKKIEELTKPYQKYFSQPEIDFSVKDPFSLLKIVEQKLKKKAKRVSHFDGLTMEFSDWWFNLRASQTEKFLRLNLEAKSFKDFQKGLKIIKKIIKENG